MASRLEVEVGVAVRVAFGVVFAFGVAGVACTTASAGSSSSAGGLGSSTAGTSAGVAPGSSSGSGTGSGTTSGTSGSTAGTTGSSTGSPFVDGGYVYCSLPNDGGLARWMCRPGTYFCDLGGNLGNCFACRSDADCADESLPTYDPLRPRCDLDSGIAGYEDFCQQCLRNADCAGNPAGVFCDTNPTYPPNALEAPIEALGFETCGRVQTDCRQEGGPQCSVSNQVCNPFNGQCFTRSGACTTDQDCAGLLEPPGGDPLTGSAYLLHPYCVDGSCNSCAGGVCPNNDSCQSDADCGNPTGSPEGPTCQPLAAHAGGLQCVCTSGTQCSGFWPACTGLDAGNFDDAGQPIGVCSCDTDAQCGDAGLACLAPGGGVIYGPQRFSNFCGVPCTSPAFTSSCAAITGGDICLIQSGECDLGGCSDESCESSLGSGGPYCDTDFPNGTGYCGCILDADCTAGDSCLGYESHSPVLGICTATFSRCTPEACGGYFCNWDSGACVQNADLLTFPSCINDADCSGPDPVCVDGACVACRDNADCLHAGETRATLCCTIGRADQPCQNITSFNVCVDGCAVDQDCVGNVQGSSCLTQPDGSKRCGCAADGGCQLGIDAGVACGGKPCLSCMSPADCPDDEGCDSQSHSCGTCRGPTAAGGPFDCPPDAVCSNYWLGTVGACLPNCDRESCPADRPICAALPSLTPDHKYCFGCLQDVDCGDAGAWCDQSFKRTFTCQEP